MHARQGQRQGSAMRLGLRAAAVAALLACAAGSVYAGSEERKGTGGATELRLPVGPRGSALGGTVVSDVTGVEAMFWNPAGLGSLERTQAMFTHTEYFAGMNLNYAGVAMHVGGVGTLGFQAKVLSIGDVIVTTEDAPEGTGEITSPNFSVLGVSWGRRFTDRVLFGATVNYVNERILNTSAQGLALDLGVQYFTGWHGLKFGVAMKNFGPAMHFEGPDFETNIQPPGSDPTSSNRTFRTTSADFEMPSYFSLSASYDLFTSDEHRFAVLGSFQNNNFVGDNLQGGAEWAYRDIVALRGSYFASVRSQEDPLTGDSSTELGSGDDLYSGLALGAGVRVPLGGTTHLGVDVAWRSVREFFDDTVELGAKLGF